MGLTWLQHVAPWRFKSASAKAVLLAMAFRKNDQTGLCCPSVAMLEEDTCLCHDAVCRAILELERSGAISVQRINGRGSKYTISPTFNDQYARTTGTSDRPVSVKDDTGTSDRPDQSVRQTRKGNKKKKKESQGEEMKRTTSLPLSPKEEIRGKRTVSSTILKVLPGFASQSDPYEAEIQAADRRLRARAISIVDEVGLEAVREWIDQPERFETLQELKSAIQREHDGITGRDIRFGYLAAKNIKIQEQANAARRRSLSGDDDEPIVLQGLDEDTLTSRDDDT